MPDPPLSYDNGNPMLAIRRRRAGSLVPTVRPVFGGYRVSSSSREVSYLITQPNGHLVCTCADFLRHDDEPEFRCKHTLAVEMAIEQDRLPNDGSEPIDSTCPPGSVYVFGDDGVRLKVIKNSKGYSWEISVAEKDPEAALLIARALEQKVRAEYGHKSQFNS